MKESILYFINKRFQLDCNWKTGNCYYFAIILQNRFGGDIYYDVIDGHFVIKINNEYYDWSGNIKEMNSFIKWDDFDSYDKTQKERIIRDCIN